MFFKGREMDEFKQEMDRFIQRLLVVLHSSLMPAKEGMFNGACKTVYGHCNFGVVCAAPDEIAARHFIRSNFIQKTYNPLEFH